MVQDTINIRQKYTGGAIQVKPRAFIEKRLFLSESIFIYLLSASPAMDSDHAQIIHDFQPFFRVHNTGRIERYYEADFLPPSEDPKTGVVSKDVVISPENNVSARIYLPQNKGPDKKLPLIIYCHGGAFSIGSAFSSLYHNHINVLAAESRSVVVSIEYRLAPEHPLPACYEDCWTVTKWVEAHSRDGQGPEPWLNDYVDFGRVFLAGDSAGANIAHDMISRASAEKGSSLSTTGLILVHPYFGSGKSDPLWNFICPETTGVNDSRLNPAAHTDLLSKLRCNRVLVCVAEKDLLKKRGGYYYQALKKSDWKGVIEFFESEGEAHVFHLFDGDCDKSVSLLKRIVDFINWEPVPSVL